MYFKIQIAQKIKSKLKNAHLLIKARMIKKFSLGKFMMSAPSQFLASIQDHFDLYYENILN